MEKLVMLTQFLLGLSIIVGLHELGHMLFAKLFGMRVEKYAIGFPPKILHFKWGETEYSLGAIPLGGFVKISGMIDESLDTKHLSNAPQPWEFRAKPAWQRLLVMMGGILFNVISGVIIFILIVFSLGDTYLPKGALNKHGLIPNVVGKRLGFQEGDKIINICGEDFERFSDIISPQTLLKHNGYYTVLRDEEEVRISIPPNFIEELATSKNEGSFVEPLIPFQIEHIQQGSNAEKAGLRKGDKIIKVNGENVIYFQQLKNVLETYAGEEVTLTYVREGRSHLTVAEVDETGRLGFQPKLLLSYETKKYSPVEAVSIGTSRAFGIVWVNAIALGKIFNGQVSVSKSLSGPIKIAQIFSGNFDWIHFWGIIGFLSMVLAFINFLPIPALDGGHVLFLVYEIIVGRSLPSKFLEIAQKIGLALLLGLIIYVILNDLYNLF